MIVLKFSISPSPSVLTIVIVMLSVICIEFDIYHVHTYVETFKGKTFVVF